MGLPKKTQSLCPECKAVLDAEILEENGKAMKLGYLDQSNQLETLFERFDAPDVTAKIEANGMQPLYDHLKSAQQSFRNVWTESVESAANKEEIPTLRDAANDLLDAVNKTLFKRLDIEAEDEGEPFTTAIAIINEAVQETERVQRARIARNETDDTPIEPGAGAAA